MTTGSSIPPLPFPSTGYVSTARKRPVSRVDQSQWVRREHQREETRLSDIVSALSFALDITEGQPMGHSVRSTIIAMKIADQLGLSDDQRSALYYGTLLKDLGCSSNSARLASIFGADDHALKHANKLTDWTADTENRKYAMAHAAPGRGRMAKAWHILQMALKERGSGREMIQTRCETGADIAQMLGLPKGAAEAIRALDEHWDGNGKPYGLSGSGIPMLGRIASLAQTVEVFVTAFDVGGAYEMAQQRKGRWFDPVLVDCLEAFRLDTEFWGRLEEGDNLLAVQRLEPEEKVILIDEARLDVVSEAFARVIDAKSPYTAGHSRNVSMIAVSMGESMGMREGELRMLRRASLLHDIGKLGVSNAILDKPSALEPAEFQSMKQHTFLTLEILRKVGPFRHFAVTAAAHHERLNGSGYHLGLNAESLGVMSRVIAAADVTEALSANRPYRAGMPVAKVFAILDDLVRKEHLDPAAVESLQGVFTGLPDAVPLAEPLVSAA